MRFTGGTLSLLLSATAVAASIYNNAPGIASTSVSRSGLFGVVGSSSSGVLGLSKTLSVPRGGASEEEASDSEQPVELYLPGLLTANVSRKTVRRLSLFYDQRNTFVCCLI